MKIWTLQRKEVVDIIEKEGYYQPNFEKSDFIRDEPELKALYQLVLRGFNCNNNINSPGVIFGFMESDADCIHEISDFGEFLEKHKKQLCALWNRMLKQGKSVLLELEYNVEFNPIFIDLNDFQFLMPPIITTAPYQESDIERLCNNILDGEVYHSKFPSGVIQVHAPNIFREDIVGIYDLEKKDVLQETELKQKHVIVNDKIRNKKLQLFLYHVKDISETILFNQFDMHKMELDYTNSMDRNTMLPCVTYYGKMEHIVFEKVDISNIFVAYEFCVLHGLIKMEDIFVSTTAFVVANEFQIQYRKKLKKEYHKNSIVLQKFTDTVQEFAEKELKEYLQIDNIYLGCQIVHDKENGKIRVLYDAVINERRIEGVEVTDLYDAYEFCDSIGKEKLESDIIQTAEMVLVTVFQGKYLYPL